MISHLLVGHFYVPLAIAVRKKAQEANLHEREKFAIRGPALEWLEGGH
jgi:hypothetical protein